MENGGGDTVVNAAKVGAGSVIGATSAVAGSSRQNKVIVISVSLGVAILGVLAHYFRRRRATAGKKLKSTCTTLLGTASNSKDQHSNILMKHSGSPLPGSIGFGGRSSVASSRFTDTTLISNSVVDAIGYDTSNLNFTQLGVLGLESVEKSIHYWENALALLKNSGDALPEDDKDKVEPNPDTAHTIAHLDKILDAAYTLQRLTEDLFLHENSVLYAESERSYKLRTVSSVDSFMSAEDFLSDDDDITMSLKSVKFDMASKSIIFPLYEAALRHVENGAVPYRSLRTDLAACKYGDNEYLAKLHCLRGAFSRIVSDGSKRMWIAQGGKEVFSQILLKADKDPREFEITYDAMISWSQEPGNWALTESDLKERGVRALTFYDIVLDFIFLDAFEDLDAPPASVLAVTQNRWLSNSFKETALNTAVWSVLKTKRRCLKYSDGFVAHFYDVSEHVMPALAWGFLGPPSELQDLCIFFKESFLAFLRAIFSFDKVRYTTLDNLAEDVYVRLEEMHAVVMERLEDATQIE